MLLFFFNCKIVYIFTILQLTLVVQVLIMKLHQTGERYMNKLIPRTSLGESVANVIRERIILGEYPSGMKLKEEHLAEEFELSRICVREAMLILDREGLLDKKLNRSTCVRSYTEKDVRDLLSYRVVLETTAALGCMDQKKIPEDALEACLKNMGNLRSAGTSTVEYLEADIIYHDTLIRALDNEYINISWDAIRSQFLMLMYALYKVRTDEFYDGYDNHRKILELMKEGNKEELQELIRFSILSNCDSISQFVCEE